MGIFDDNMVPSASTNSSISPCGLDFLVTSLSKILFNNFENLKGIFTNWNFPSEEAENNFKQILEIISNDYENKTMMEIFEERFSSKRILKLSQEATEIAKEIGEIEKKVTSKNKVNFISGTVAPAPSSKRENYLNIEDLRIGLNLLADSYSNDLSTTCGSNLQGYNRLQRGLVYMSYLKWYSGEKQRYTTMDMMHNCTEFFLSDELITLTLYSCNELPHSTIYRLIPSITFF
jgi:hypothetical protein